MTERSLGTRQGRALVRFDVGSGPGAGQRPSHGAQVGVERAGVDEQRRRGELPGLH